MSTPILTMSRADDSARGLRRPSQVATFALGRDGERTMGVVIVDEDKPIPAAMLDELRTLKAIREVRLVRV